MIVTKIVGGLGNQLFQYAIGRRLAVIHNTALSLDISAFSNYHVHDYSLNHFNISANIIKTPKGNTNNKIMTLIKQLLGRKEIDLVNEKFFHFDPDLFHLPDNVSLDGYWQSEKYFIDIEPLIREDLTIVTPPDSINRETAANIAGCNAVNLHIRRGDYVSNAAANVFHGTCTLEYYKRASEWVARNTQNPVFFVFSDDINWAKDNLRLDYTMIFVGHNGPDKNYEDLRLMSLCKHHIIANSTFSWWGAWLSTNPAKIVCAPKNWFANPTHNTKDLIPDSWIKL